MSSNNIMGLLGGLALFLYGMQMTSSGMEEAAGNKMKDILQKLTSTWWSAVTMGAAITCLLQSSSASTVMVVGFVNSKMMTLQQAVWIIMGANIGTTIVPEPAKYAAPKAVVSRFLGLKILQCNISLWNCIKKLLAHAPPSTAR